MLCVAYCPSPLGVHTQVTWVLHTQNSTAVHPPRQTKQTIWTRGDRDLLVNVILTLRRRAVPANRGHHARRRSSVKAGGVHPPLRAKPRAPAPPEPDKDVLRAATRVQALYR
jgi:hypothetical protein